MKKETLAGLAGLVDPVLRNSAQKLAASLPQNSLLRSEAVEAFLGALKGFIEVNAEKLSPLASVLVEKTTDYLDFVAGAIGPENDFETAHQKWQDKFLSESAKRLRKAEDPAKECERIKLELELQHKIKESLMEKFGSPRSSFGVAGPAKKPDAEPNVWVPAIENLNNKLATLKDELTSWAQRS
ncbi:MAG: hypothetical protein Q8Q97_01065 [bacterium]|nr:hypothetical protein [bacterium]